MATEEIFRNPEEFEQAETMETTASTKNFQNEVRQWFTAMSPEERAAVLGFEDDSLVVAAILSQIASPAPPPTGSNGNKRNNEGSPDEQRSNISILHTPTSSLPPKRTADELFSNEAFDWEAKVAIEIIEKTWEEIMMVGVPNTSGVNQKEFVKNAMNHQNDDKNGGASPKEQAKCSPSTDNGYSNSTDTQVDQGASNTGIRNLDDTSNTDIVSDAYRIQNEGVDVVGKTASAIAQEGEGDVGTSVSESSEPRVKGENVGSSPAGEGESNIECASPSAVSPLEVATTAITTTTSSPSAIHGIEAGLQYPSDNNNSRRIAEVMEHTRCIFPSASKITSATTNGDQISSNELLLQRQRNQKQPFITINPSYLESVTGDELLVAFDEIMAMAYTDSSSDEPCSFILPEEATSASWIDLVRSYASTDTSNPETQLIPLYILVLCRFQHSLAKAYSERDVSEASHKSGAQWLSALMTRIRQLENDNSPEIQQVISKLASNSDNQDKKPDLEQCLLLPFKVVASRLGRENGSNCDDALKKIDWCIGEVLPDCKTTSGEPPLVEKSLSSNTETAQVANGVSSDNNALPNGDGHQNVPNNGSNATPNGGRKGKKKKKKKKRKGSGAGAAAKSKPVEKEIGTTVDDKPVLEEKHNVTETPTEAPLGNVIEQKDAEVVDVQVDKEISVVEVEKPAVIAPVPDAQISTLPNANVEEEKVASELPQSSASDAQNTIQPSKTDSSESVEKAQAKGSDEEVHKSKKDSPPKETEDKKEDDSDDQWETVEIRPRCRKKSTDKGDTTRPGSQRAGNNGNSNGQNGKKKAPRTKETRAKTKNRKMVREILGGVLDAVEETVRKRRALSRERAANARRNQTPSLSSNSNSTSLPTKNSSSTTASQNPNTQQKTGSSLRDILLRGKGNNQSQQPRNQNTTKATPFSYSERARLLMSADSNTSSRRKNEKPSHITGSKTAKALKAARASPADQNTIPTIASTNSAFTPSVTNVTSRKSGVGLSTDSSDSESVEAQKPKDTPADPIKFASPSPPLPTLLNPGNNNSTSSSVASSLDAPHAGHHGNKSRQSENDVGCHLLDVCDRLSTEIDVFMKRRKDALTVRRHERGLVLAALEKTLGLIWAGKPVVEMYGSCATNLDLPSSDLDVVVCGLDRPFVDTVTSPASSPSAASNARGDKSPAEKTKNQEDGSPDADSRKDGSSFPSDQHYSRHQMSQYQMQMMYGHMSVNAERVLRLAMELEHQPWAVHVKAIPTASVPVVKILADPARLQGAVMNGNADWLVQQPISGQSPPSLSAFPDGKDPRSGNQTPSMSQFQNQQSSPLWRGADVVNGLLKVDITFEGPEHGGIGSTKFSQKVVEDFSSETGLAPECTPQVQTLMVLKELLAQRRSNEPFSGGLSSYALLLLVVSMIGERKIIREELEKTERQRRVVAAGGGNSALRSTPIDLMESTGNNDTKQSAEKAQSQKPTQPKPEDNHSNVTKATTPQQNDGATKSTSKTKELPKPSAWQGRQEKQDQKKPVKKTTPAVVAPPAKQKLPVVSSWASIARKPTAPAVSKKKKDTAEKGASESKSEAKPVTPETKAPSKPSSFADAVAKGKPMQAAKVSATPKKAATAKKPEGKKRFDGLLDPPPPKSSKAKAEKDDSKNTMAQQTKANAVVTEEAKAQNNNSSATSNQPKESPAAAAAESNLGGPLDSSGFPQGCHDVIEVLCSGETTPGKLLMHFLLFYGQHFDSQATAIDYSGTHPRDAGANNGYSVRSSYMLRRNTGSYDPVTGMYTVDPIVVYDPLEGAENNNVARSCFAWNSIRWVFAQSYMTLSSAAEQNTSDASRNRSATAAREGPAYGHDESGHVVVDPSSPLLELLLSY